MGYLPRDLGYTAKGTQLAVRGPGALVKASGLPWRQPCGGQRETARCCKESEAPHLETFSDRQPGPSVGVPAPNLETAGNSAAGTGLLWEWCCQKWKLQPKMETRPDPACGSAAAKLSQNCSQKWKRCPGQTWPPDPGNFRGLQEAPAGLWECRCQIWKLPPKTETRAPDPACEKQLATYQSPSGWSQRQAVPTVGTGPVGVSLPNSETAAKNGNSAARSEKRRKKTQQKPTKNTQHTREMFP